MTSSADYEDTRGYPKSLIIGLVIIAFVAGKIWLRLASPYLPFPSDDKSWYFLFNDYFGSLQSQRPVFHLLLYALKQLCTVCPDGKILITTIALSHAVIAVIVGLLSFRITGSIIVAFAGAVVYATSAWPANYYFLASYAPFAGVFAMLSLLLLVEASFGGKQRRNYLLIAGFLTGLYFWSSPSAPVLIALFLGAVAVFINDAQQGDVQVVNGKFRLIVTRLYRRFLNTNVRTYLVAMAVSISLFVFSTTPRLYKEVVVNMYSNSYPMSYAPALYGPIPDRPLLSFYKIYYLYNPYLMALLISALLLVFLMYSRFGMRKMPETPKRVLAMLALLITLYALLIDVLPFATLGRYQFVIYPITIVVICSVSYYLLRSFQVRITRIYAAVAVSLLTGVVLASNVSGSSELIEARKTIVNTITQYSGDLDIYILNEDPHRHHLVRSLNSPELTVSIKKINLVDFIKVLETAEKSTHRPALLLGPRGRDSGKSAILHTTDFYPDRLAGFPQLESKAIKKINMLYYAY
jgi:MFS family permease